MEEKSHQPYVHSFEKLEIWKLAIQLSVDIYKLTAFFPEGEKFGLVSQLRRASNSISANIAEGIARSGQDKVRFIRIAFGSTIEVLSHLILAQNLEFITDGQLEVMRNQVNQLSNKINAFHNKISLL